MTGIPDPGIQRAHLPPNVPPLKAAAASPPGKVGQQSSKIFAAPSDGLDQLDSRRVKRALSKLGEINERCQRYIEGSEVPADRIKALNELTTLESDIEQVVPKSATELQGLKAKWYAGTFTHESYLHKHGVIAKLNRRIADTLVLIKRAKSALQEPEQPKAPKAESHPKAATPPASLEATPAPAQAPHEHGEPISLPQMHVQESVHAAAAPILNAAAVPAMSREEEDKAKVLAEARELLAALQKAKTLAIFKDPKIGEIRAKLVDIGSEEAEELLRLMTAAKVDLFKIRAMDTHLRTIGKAISDLKGPRDSPTFFADLESLNTQLETLGHGPALPLEGRRLAMLSQIAKIKVAGEQAMVVAGAEKLLTAMGGFSGLSDITPQFRQDISEALARLPTLPPTSTTQILITGLGNLQKTCDALMAIKDKLKEKFEALEQVSSRAEFHAITADVKTLIDAVGHGNVTVKKLQNSLRRIQGEFQADFEKAQQKGSAKLEAAERIVKGPWHKELAALRNKALALQQAVTKAKPNKSKKEFELLSVELAAALMKIVALANKIVEFNEKQGIPPSNEDKQVLRSVAEFKGLATQFGIDNTLGETEERWQQMMHTGRISGMQETNELRKVAVILSRKMAEYLHAVEIAQITPKGKQLPAEIYKSLQLFEEIKKALEKLNKTAFKDTTMWQAIKGMTWQGNQLGAQVADLAAQFGWIDEADFALKGDTLARDLSFLALQIDKLEGGEKQIAGILKQNEIPLPPGGQNQMLQAIHRLAAHEFAQGAQFQFRIREALAAVKLPLGLKNEIAIAQMLEEEIGRQLRNESFQRKDLTPIELQKKIEDLLRQLLQGKTVGNVVDKSVFNRGAGIDPPKKEIVDLLVDRLIPVVEDMRAERFKQQANMLALIHDVVPERIRAGVVPKLQSAINPLFDAAVAAFKLQSITRDASKELGGADRHVQTDDMYERVDTTREHADNFFLAADKKKWAMEYQLGYKFGEFVSRTIPSQYVLFSGEGCPFRDVKEDPEALIAMHNMLKEKDPANDASYAVMTAALLDIQKAFNAASPLVRGYYNGEGYPIKDKALTAEAGAALDALHNSLKGIYDKVKILTWKKSAKPPNYPEAAERSQALLMSTLGKAFRVINQVKPHDEVA